MVISPPGRCGGAQASSQRSSDIARGGRGARGRFARETDEGQPGVGPNRSHSARHHRQEGGDAPAEEEH